MAFFRSSRRLTGLLRAHCDREEAILGQLAERSLSVEQDEILFCQFMQKRAQVESYTNFSRLERRYVTPGFTPLLSQDAGLAGARETSY